MEKTSAILALSALAHDVRLDTFRALAQAGDTGLLAGQMARDLSISPTTLSNNLKVLSHAGLIHARREGRGIRYFVTADEMRALLGYLTEDCCGGRPELCAPLAAQGTKRTS